MNENLIMLNLESIQPAQDFVKAIRVDRGKRILIMESQNIYITYPEQLEFFRHQIGFETVPYDCRQFYQQQHHSYFLASSKGMPLRIYRMDDQNKTIQNFGSIVDRKQNSEKYLSPLQIALYHDIIIGAGQKFMAKYQIQRLKAHRFGCMDKINLSSIEIMQNDQIIAGTFEGALHFIDEKSHQITNSIHVHMDSVTNILKHPSNEHIFVTTARKDNFRYIWDRRYMDSFMKCLEYQSYSNQRIGVAWSENGQRLFSGSEFGFLIQWPFLINDAQKYIRGKEIKLSGISGTINTITKTNNSELIFSTGHRRFPDCQQNLQTNKIGILQFQSQ